MATKAKAVEKAVIMGANCRYLGDFRKSEHGAECLCQCECVEYVKASGFINYLLKKGTKILFWTLKEKNKVKLENSKS